MSQGGDELRRLAHLAGTEGGRAAANAMAEAGRAEIRAQLSKRAHAKGTPTPSPPGQPPALVSGLLRGSVTVTGAVPAGAYRWTSSAGPNTVYARIQDRGGVAGAGHSVHLPPRPYMLPAAVTGAGRISAAALAAFARVVH